MSRQRWTIKDLLKVTSDYLEQKEIETPRLCAEVLLAHQLNLDRVKLYLAFDQPLQEEEVNAYRSLIKRRLRREPTQYITGTQEFWSMEFHVCPDVLIPRAESELLVEQALGIFREQGILEASGRAVLDLGTGSGAIAVSLAKELKNADVWASDVSQKALDTARLNSERHSVEDRIKFLKGDLFQPFENESVRFDVIVSNPPYITSEEYDSLPKEVRDYEPRLALDGYEGGLFFVRKIIMEGMNYLKPGGWLLIEMDPGQTSAALDMFEESGRYKEKRRVRDYSGNYRVAMARRI